jgi:formylmethanofuran dehydrogenase subunit C
MSALRLVLRAPPDTRLDLSPLIPERLAGLDQATVERIELGTRRNPCRVGDLFDVHLPAPVAADATIRIEGGSHRFDRVGAGMATGEVVVEGDTGQYTGRLLGGGRLTIRGNAGDWAGSRLAGGTLEITGSAGNFLGGPLAGELAGMTGGRLIIRGNAGDRPGDLMRRGIIVIEGSAGAASGSRMIAGTLIVCGRCGPLPGYLMRRGTLVVGRPAELLATFNEAGGAAAAFHHLLARVVEGISPKAARLVVRAAVRFIGDMATLGKGELLIPVSVIPKVGK